MRRKCLSFLFLALSDRKMDLKLFMTKIKDGGLMWCGTSGKVSYCSVISVDFKLRVTSLVIMSQ